MRLLSIAALAAALTMTTAAIANPQTDYLSANAKKAGVKVVAGGLQYRVIKTGKGAKPGPTDCATVNYKGSFINGKVFDASKPGAPITFPVNRVIPGWTEALQMMRPGDRWELTIPSTLGYGDAGTPGGPIPGGATLIFDVELLKVSPAEMGLCPG
ncbi:MAG TPA: FKBP-type peptidyl-prolyl cis-trans isomerase [Rhizobiaceae bacterium]|nr:FKBP-type peptidyl-prolyl cis-trans isomerase [Rhizobiaceae bacterium]